MPVLFPYFVIYIKWIKEIDCRLFLFVLSWSEDITSEMRRTQKSLAGFHLRYFLGKPRYTGINLVK
jgi:hypothetical protein